MSAAEFTAIGIDIGGTKTAAAIVSFPGGQVQCGHEFKTEPERGGDALLEQIEQVIVQITVESSKQIQAVGIGLCEIVDNTGVVRSENCVRWQQLDVAKRLSRFGPVLIEADVRAAALAEALFGSGRDSPLFLYITIGTGISSCLVVDGKPFSGTRGAAGTMASTALGLLCPKCGELNRQSLEDLSSGPALVARYGDPGIKCAQEVLAAAEAGDSSARSVVVTGAEALGAGIGWLVNVLDPERVVIGGGLGLSRGLYWNTLADATREHIWSELNREIRIFQAATGKNAGIIGAAASAWTRTCFT
jgi:glucokinase